MTVLPFGSLSGALHHRSPSNPSRSSSVRVSAPLGMGRMESQLDGYLDSQTQATSGYAREREQKKRLSSRVENKIEIDG